MPTICTTFCTRREGVLNVLGETDPVTRRMNNSAKRRKLGSKRRSLEGCRQRTGDAQRLQCPLPRTRTLAAMWLVLGYLFRKRASGSRNTKPHKGNKQKAHGLSPTFSRRNLTFVTFLGEFTFLGPRPLPEELSESATRVSDSVCLRCQRRAGTHTIKALAEVCEVETSALECSRNGMTKSASSLSLKLQVSAERCAQATAATCSDAGCCAAAVPEKPATPENGNPPTETNHRSTA